MAEYRIVLSRRVLQHAVHYVEAASEEEACDLAIEAAPNLDWEEAYSDEGLDIDSCDRQDLDPDALRDAYEADREYHAKWGI